MRFRALNIPTGTERNPVSMSYVALDKFPQFRGEDLPTLSVLASAHPSIEKARRFPRIYIESRVARQFRTEHIGQKYLRCDLDLLGRPLGAYCDTRQSVAYPRLTAFVEAEVSPTLTSWALRLHARHGNQESLGGTFEFTSYPAACAYMGGWIWFACGWIGTSWTNPVDQDYPLAAIERVDLKLLSGIGLAINATQRSPIDTSIERRVVEEIFRLASEEPDESDPKRAELPSA
jgi:hypothetical protein